MSEAGYIILIPSVAHVYNYIIFDSLNKKFFIYFFIQKKLKHLVEEYLEPELFLEILAFI